MIATRIILCGCTLFALTGACPREFPAPEPSADATPPRNPFYKNPLNKERTLASLDSAELGLLCDSINEAITELRGQRGLRAFCVAGAVSQNLSERAGCQAFVDRCLTEQVMASAVARRLECSLLNPRIFSGCDTSTAELAACINHQADRMQPLFDSQQCGDGLSMEDLGQALMASTDAVCTSLETRCPAVLDLTCPLQDRCGGQPRHPFDAQAAPLAPDYALDESWMLLPDTFTLGDWAPPQINRERDLHDKPVDVFFVHPTTYGRHENWNSPVPPLLEQNSDLQAVGLSEASVFSGCCQVFAPHYREATLHSFFAHMENPPRDDGRAALELAYDDVQRAFTRFVADRSPGRPFIIAGHSPCNLHALRPRAEQVDGSAIGGRLVAAYTLGFAAPLDLFERNLTHITPCDAASQTTCLVHWDTFARDATRPFAGFHYYPGHGWEDDVVKPILCVNPLNWHVAASWVAAGEHMGALTAGGELRAALTPAGCVDGMLQVDRSIEPLYAGLVDVDLGVYHAVDFALFYADLRANAVERSRRYLGR